MSVTVIVTFHAAEGKADALRALLEHGRDVSRRAEGCEDFEIHQREDDPNECLFVERWTSIEAHHANMQTNIVETGHLAKILPLLSRPIESGAYRTV
ncbi:MAG: antibiotic biosynthesis monooxygenase [Actinobacteria bacterium]|nr:antibiotic biosynthesis monooxygenase [Actinomycetota bacterium]